MLALADGLMPHTALDPAAFRSSDLLPPNIEWFSGGSDTDGLGWAAAAYADAQADRGVDRPMVSSTEAVRAPTPRRARPGAATSACERGPLMRRRLGRTMARSRRKDGQVSMDIQQTGPEVRAVAKIAPRRARVIRREEAVIQAEIRRLARALRHTASGRVDAPRRNDDPDLYPAA